jgi:alpha-beta hydrolase superfamily lysophospholipase
MNKQFLRGFFLLISLVLVGTSARSMSDMDQKMAAFSIKDDVTKIYKISAEKPVAIALVGHGLNTKPTVMKDVIGMLNEQGVTCVLVQLSGHRGDEGAKMTADNWLKDWNTAFTVAQSMAKEAGVKLMVVAHSMGCLVNSCHLASTDSVEELAGCVYLAPADGLKGMFKGLLPIASSPLGAMMGGQLKGVGTTFAGSNAAQADMPMCAFASLDKLLQQADSSEYCTAPTIVFVDATDSLIDAAYLSGPFGQDKGWEVNVLPEGGAMAHMCINDGHPGFTIIKEEMAIIIARFISSEDTYKPGRRKEVQEGAGGKKAECVLQ